MNRRLLTILLSAFVVAILCSYLVFRVVGQRLNGGPTTTRIVAAATDIKLGTVLRSSDLTTIAISGTLPKGAIVQPANIIGRGVLSNLYAGGAHYGKPSCRAGFWRRYGRNDPLRACGHAPSRWMMWSEFPDFATPGMRVDVLISGSPSQSASAGSRVRTLLQNIEVLSAGTDIQRDGEGKPRTGPSG